MSPKQRFNITLEQHQIDKLREIEQKNGLSASAQIRLAISRWVESNEAPEREQMAAARPRPKARRAKTTKKR